LGAPVIGSPFQVPGFVTDVPYGYFAGISAPMVSLDKARKSAVSDVVRQVLGSIGVSYDHRYQSFVSGNPRNPHRLVSDNLSGTSHGIVLDVERNIVKNIWLKDGSGLYVCFILVRYDGRKISEMRRLSKDAKVIAYLISVNYENVKLRVAEVNGVSVVLTSADVRVRKQNRFAKTISFFIWPVPDGSEYNKTIAVGPVRVRGNSLKIKLNLNCRKNLVDYLLGAKLTRVVVLKGHDELGRPISAKIVF